MTTTVANTLPLDQRLDPSKWPVPEMPDVPVEPWANDPDAFWKQSVADRDVDHARTAALRAFNDMHIGFRGGGTPWQGSSYGQPFQLLHTISSMTQVWDMSRAPTWRGRWVWGGWGVWWRYEWSRSDDPLVDLPLPELVRRMGDPMGSSDVHWVGMSSDRLYEAILLLRTPLNLFNTYGTTEWTCGYNGSGPGASAWDTTRPWNAPGQPGGAVATGVPRFPMIVRWDQVRAAAATDRALDHCMFMGVPNYDKTWEGAARASDGDLTGFPLKGGTILRLRAEVVDLYEPGTVERVIAKTAHERGMFVGDRNAHLRGQFVGAAGCDVTMDRRFAVGDATTPGLADGFALRLHDCEVVG